MKNIIGIIPGLKMWLNFFRNLIYKLSVKNLSLGYNNDLKKVIFESNNALGQNVSIHKSTIGSYTYISDNSTIRHSTIGRFCSIGPGVKIGLGKHPFNEFISSHPLFYSSRKQIGFSVLKHSIYKEFEDVKVGNDVWIGANVIILDGVKIGDGAVIAAGSVVIRDVKPFELVAGIPAIHKKYKFSEDRINEILIDPWWEKDFDVIKKIINKN
ncbi:MAG: CatB-related O-acetyltransferase [Putridiphycobacter sp.]